MNRMNNSNQKLAKSRDSLVNKSQSSGDVRQMDSNKLIQNSKITSPIGFTPKTSYISSQRRLSADNSQLECNGRNRYGSFPRSRSQSSQLRISESNPNRISQNQFSSCKPTVNKTEKAIKSIPALIPSNSCRQVKTWAFKHRSRLPIDDDLYNKPHICQTNPINYLSDNHINSHIMPTNDLSDSQKSLDLDTSLENSSEEKLFEKMKLLVNQYDIKQKTRHNFDDLNELNHYQECPPNQSVIYPRNRPYVSKIPTLQ